MALGRMNPTYSHAPVMMTATGYAILPIASPPANYVIPTQKAALTVGANGATIGQSQTCGPDSRVPVVVNPTTAYAATVANIGANTNIFMLDLRAFPSDIVNVDAGFVPANATAGSVVGNAVGSFCILGIDNVNKFIYFGAYNVNGSNIGFGLGMGIQWSVTFKDIVAI